MTVTASSPLAAPTGSTPQWVSVANQATVSALRQTITVLHPDLANIVAYHKGWVDAEGNAVAARSPGKGVRPALSMWAAQAVGAAPEVGLPAAIAVELIHDFTLLHDDIIDNDATRRGRPTAWTVFGSALALLSGDALHALAHYTLVDAGPRGAEASRRLAYAVMELCRGQRLDVDFERRDDVSVPKYLSMIEGKTGALLRCSVTMGAVLAGADTATVNELDRVGHHLGMLFQIVDDLLGIFGDPAVTGKPVGSDLVRHKKTLPIIASLNSPDSAGKELAAVLSRPEITEQDVEHAAALIEQAGGREHAQRECAWHHGQVLATLARLDLAEQPDAMLRELADFLIDRTF